MADIDEVSKVRQDIEAALADQIILTEQLGVIDKKVKTTRELKDKGDTYLASIKREISRL